jgi:hypothetical protein
MISGLLGLESIYGVKSSLGNIFFLSKLRIKRSSRRGRRLALKKRDLCALRRCKLLRGWNTCMCVETKLHFTFCLQPAPSACTCDKRKRKKAPERKKGRVLSHSPAYILKLAAHTRLQSVSRDEGSGRE